MAALTFSRTDYPLPVALWSVNIGDFNGDGHADLVTANIDSNGVSVLLGNGDGTYGAAGTLATGAGPSSIAIADLNGDGLLDLTTSNVNSNNVSVLLGNGAGGFGNAAYFGTGTNPRSVVLGDLNGDGKLDLVTSNQSSSVSVLLGAGDGTFGATTNITVGSGIHYALALSDFNLDGKLDLAVAGSDTNDLSVLLGNGDGTFGAAAAYAVGTSPYSIAVGDFNGDGQQDLATSTGGTVSVLLGAGDGTFGAATQFDGAGVVKAADVNGDGKLDLVTSSASVLLGNGDGTFADAINFAAGSQPSSVAVGDLGGTSLPDLVVVNYSAQPPFGKGSIAVLLNTTDAPTITSNDGELVAFYAFDEASGSTAHDQQGQYDGTIIGTAHVAGVTGNALQFDGSNAGYVSVPNSSDWNFGTGDFSIEVWANFSSDPSGSAGQLGDVLVAHDEGGGSTNKWVLDAYSGHLGFHVNNTAGQGYFAEVPFNPTLGQWYLIDLVETGSTFQFYVNGELIGTAPAVPIPDASTPLTIGYTNDGLGITFGGSLDGVGIYHSALTQAEIQQRYQEGAAAPDAASAAISIPENTTAVTTVTATDPDAGQTLSYSIIGGADAALFGINATTGVFGFLTAPDYENPTDAGANNVYDVTVQVSDGNGGTDTQAIAVTVTNEPTIVTVTATTTAATEGNDVVFTFHRTGDISSSMQLDFGYNGSATNEVDFTWAGNNGLPPRFEAGSDTYVHRLTTFSDGLTEGSESLGVYLASNYGYTVGDPPTATATLYDPLAITSDGGGNTATISVPENGPPVTTVTASDLNPAHTITYSISGGADAGKFSINPTSGALAFVTAPNFEAPSDVGGNNVYDVTVQAADGNGGTDTQAIAVTVTNVSGNIVGDSGDNILPGTSEEDTISGLAGNDTLIGLAGNDTLDGGADNDLLRGGAGVDTFIGGSGSDTVDFSQDAAEGGTFRAVVDLIQGLARDGFNNLETLSGIENAIGTQFNDVFTGNALANTFTGLDGNDQFTGGAGNDTLLGGAGADIFIAGAPNGGVDGNDLYDGGTGSDRLDIGGSSSVFVDLSLGTATGASIGNDTLVAIEQVSTNAGDDTIRGDSAANILFAGAGTDQLDGRGGDDQLLGYLGNDTLTGGTGNDILDGGDGNDTFVYAAGDGADTINGGKGGDTLVISGTAGNDTINVIASGASITGLGGGTVTLIEKVTLDLAGGNADTLSYAGTNTSVTVNLFSGTATGLSSIFGVENVTGGSGDDVLTGSSAANLLNGGAGNDQIDGGAGADTLFGGSGSEKFVFTNLGNSRAAAFDTITDFTPGPDHLQIGHKLTSLTTGIVKSAGTGDLAADLGSVLNSTNLGKNGAAEVTINSGTDAGTYVVINDNTAGFNANTDGVVMLTGSPLLHTTDFII